MKKSMIVFAALGAVMTAKAAVMDWSYTGSKDQVDYNVYLIVGSSASTEWANEDAVKSAAAPGGSGTIKQSGRKYGVFDQIASGITADDSFYFLVTDGTNFGVSEVFAASGLVYDPSNQETSPGSKDMSAITSLANAFGGGGDDPGTGGGDDPGTGGGDDPGTGGGDDPGTGGGDDPGTGGGESGGVPEPTSGILLMIGGAALALRRR
ncbi:MAG: PEP-CTERM sorting domain-containing protein [Oxalobacter sp.]|nr:PEP-CTERM sorting domain-containing protein [Oxalobacter sp.]